LTTSDRLSLAEPLNDAEVPVAELATTTRREEARTVMATVAGLRGRGVPVHDVAVVARDLEQYEEPLYRAAVQYGITPVFWVQLRVTQTRPYALIESVCDVLGTGEPSREILCRPLEHRWCPKSATSPSWPINTETVQASMQALPDEPRTIGEWHDELEANPETDERLVTYVEWLDECPEPSPAAVTDVLIDVVETYEERGLPVTKANDSPALVETERDARAVVRVKTLVQQLRHKYADRLEEGALDRSWSSVAELSQLIATQRPGRREHSNARAVDVLEANDVWLLDVPYVICLGLVDGEWPKQTESVVPAELQEEILRGEGRVGTLAPRTAWTTGRDRDQFDETLRAAGDGLIVTRHTESTSGEERQPSPLLEHLETDVVPADERRRLVSSERELPVAVQAMLNGEVTNNE
jgi:ATP-dependent helicase/nuclease subunit B